jgi:hypothetical protein
MQKEKMQEAKPIWLLKPEVSDKGVRLNLVSIGSIKTSIASTPCLFFGFLFQTVISNFFFKLTIYTQNQGFFFQFCDVVEPKTQKHQKSILPVVNNLP